MTTTRTQTHPAHAASLSAWEDEGGATRQAGAAGLPATEDDPVLRALGAAVVARWNELSRDARKVLFTAAAAGRQSSSRLARYLRVHRHDEA